MLNVDASAAFTLRSTEPPLLMLGAVAKPSMPPLATERLLPSVPADVPGKQFSRTTALPVEHERARGVAWTRANRRTRRRAAIARTA